MLAVRIAISRFTNEHFPGWVECLLVDVHGRTWKFVEKVPVVSTEDLWSDSEYPREGVIACTVLASKVDEQGRQVLTIDTRAPYYIESVDGATVFEVFADQLSGDEASV
jgi:hypothetical protein